MLVLKREEETDDPLVSHGGQQITLVPQMADLILQDHRVLHHRLQRVDLARVSFSHEPDLADGSVATGEGTGELRWEMGDAAGDANT